MRSRRYIELQGQVEYLELGIDLLYVTMDIRSLNEKELEELQSIIKQLERARRQLGLSSASLVGQKLVLARLMLHMRGRRQFVQPTN